MNNQLVVSEKLSIDTALRLGEVFARSGYFPDAKSSAQAVVKILAGNELGLTPMASMTGIDIIESVDGKPRLRLNAGMVAALIRSSKRYDYDVVHHSPEGCHINFYRISASGDRVPIGSSSFTIQEASLAGLLERKTKDGRTIPTNYKRYPKNMLFARAIYNGARWYCPEVFSGMRVEGTDEDIPPEIIAPTEQQDIPTFDITDMYDHPVAQEHDPAERVQRVKDYIAQLMMDKSVPETVIDDLCFELKINSLDELKTDDQFVQVNYFLTQQMKKHSEPLKKAK